MANNIYHVLVSCATPLFYLTANQSDDNHSKEANWLTLQIHIDVGSHTCCHSTSIPLEWPSTQLCSGSSKAHLARLSVPSPHVQVAVGVHRPCRPQQQLSWHVTETRRAARMSPLGGSLVPAGSDSQDFGPKNDSSSTVFQTSRSMQRCVQLKISKRELGNTRSLFPGFWNLPVLLWSRLPRPEGVLPWFEHREKPILRIISPYGPPPAG